MEYEKLTENIIGCSYRVYNKLGFGFLESVYEKALHIEMRKAGLVFETQKSMAVYYDNEVVGNFIADILVENAVVVELKSVQNLSKSHEVQLVNYLSATGMSVGLLINFGEKGVEVRRKWKDLRQGNTDP